MTRTKLAVLALYACFLPNIAYAYVDPGSGMLLLQGLVAAIGALLFAIRNPKQFFKHLVNRMRRDRRS